MMWEDDSYFPGRSGSPLAEEGTDETTSAPAPIAPVVHDEVTPVTTSPPLPVALDPVPLLQSAVVDLAAETGFPEAVGGPESLERVVREGTAPLSDSEVTSFTSTGTGVPHASEVEAARDREVSDREVTPLLSDTESETVTDVFGDLQEAMEVFSSSLRSDGSGEVCRLLLFKLLVRASSFTYQDCADLRADLISTCRGLRACGADPSGFEIMLSGLLTRAELAEDQVVASQGQPTDRYSQAVGCVEGARASLQVRVRLQDELTESRDRLSGDLMRTRARMRTLEDELASLRDHERTVSADMATVEVSLSDSAAILTSLEEDVRQAEDELRSIPVPGLLAEARQRFAIDQQILREFVAEHQG